jgi:hypothetical protein
MTPRLDEFWVIFVLQCGIKVYGAAKTAPGRRN